MAEDISYSLFAMVKKTQFTAKSSLEINKNKSSTSRGTNSVIGGFDERSSSLSEFFK